MRTVVGLFRMPTVRNVEFTGPFFHSGGPATLEQVVDFYLRGGDFSGGNLGRGVGADTSRAHNLMDARTIQ